jgi:hypothetical protein
MSSTGLPHGAYVDSEKQTINLPIGAITISFTFEEWALFIETIDDVNVVFQANLDASLYQCPSCGTVSAVYDYSEPEDEEVN